MPPAWALIAVLERVMRMRTAAGPTFDVAPGERGGFIAAQVATTAQSAACRTAVSGGRYSVVRRWLAG